MNSSRNSASLRSSISKSLNSRGKYQSLKKLQYLATTTTNEATPNQYTTLILMAVDCQKIRRNFLEHLCKKETRGPPIKDSVTIAKELAQRTVAVVMTEARTQSNLRTACIMVTKLTTAPKTAPFSWNQRKKWSKIPQNLRRKQHPENLITQCNGPPTTTNIPHPILRFFQHNLIKPAKPNLRRIINLIITPHPIICNPHHLQR
jgi:hypothetical protein